MILLESLLGGSASLPPAAVPAPELGEGGVVHVRELSLWALLHLQERNAATAAMTGPEAERSKREGLANIFAAVACKADGSAIFPDGPLKDEDRRKIEALPMSLVVRVVGSAKGRLTDAAAEAGKDSPPAGR